MKPGSTTMWRRITAGCGSSIASAHSSSPRFGHLVELPPETPLQGHVSGAEADVEARKAVSERMHRYYHSISIANGVASKNVTALCARWRLDCTDSPAPSDIVRAPSAQTMEETLRSDPLASAYSVKDVRSLQAFDRGSGNGAAHRAACHAMVLSAKAASAHFSQARMTSPRVAARSPSPIAAQASKAPPASEEPASRGTLSAKRPSDVESRFKDLISSFELD
jgi:hypothetical protein